MLAPDRTVIVNVPGFELFAYDEVGAGHPPALAMGVIVGQALRNETPFFAGTMTSVPGSVALSPNQAPEAQASR